MNESREYGQSDEIHHKTSNDHTPNGQYMNGSSDRESQITSNQRTVGWHHSEEFPSHKGGTSSFKKRTPTPIREESLAGASNYSSEEERSQHSRSDAGSFSAETEVLHSHHSNMEQPNKLALSNANTPSTDMDPAIIRTPVKERERPEESYDQSHKIEDREDNE
eukprot:1343555-Ditylum_brightwellii.AAC.1